MRKHILLIEDEAAIADTVVYALEREGYSVSWHALGRDGLAAFTQQQPDLLILDVGLPDQSGFDICRSVRQQSQLPIIFLTARADEIDRVVGFELGADDYVPKPFSPRELVARVRAILRRGQPQAIPLATGLRHDVARAQISLNGRALDLTRYEYRLLAALLAEPERVFSRAQLMDKAWDEPEASFERTVDAHIKSLRAKLRELQPECDPIRTHRGLGYSFTWDKS
ncbi:two-component system response regulator CreB [Chitinimonas sp. BJB300]|uniref:two-component system response regulator CreB n=1 Tax=Chitinimonas sp. BJB300 TaxID=1559339 RepID=UPI000C1067CF|nr:two-component system response regulator CreB [Chitinimonas sp. BJB300]PHV10367.1 two-component system response regulator CreB [Chitinimonas sp. BJB300]TSJ91037.1 two-component system response regulator CreB [Chitinimonas sp. BJB300]